ncbi:MAG: hypothetical protein QM757_20800 [Paludibaculum sp.]
MPYPFGGKQRQMMINMDAGLMQSKGLSATDGLLNAVAPAKLVVLPSGTVEDRRTRSTTSASNTGSPQGR